MTETWLTYKTWLHLDRSVQPTLKAEGEYQVTTDEDGIPISEIKGWIKDSHIKEARIGHLPCERIKVKTTRPHKTTERYTTRLNRGCWQGRVETTIIKHEKPIENPQLELF